jgi:hypothetical protein
MNKNIIMIILLDLISCGILKLLTGVVEQKTRWFLLHSLTNAVITYYTYETVKLCAIDPNNCYLREWNTDSYNAFWLCWVLHVYHAVLFKLSVSDMYHHFIMCGICGFFTYYKKTLVSTAGLFFLSGFPGMVDYFLLALVRLNKLPRCVQKIEYLFISNFVRNPGCVFVSGIGIRETIYFYSNSDYISLLCVTLSLILLFLNGTYYNLITTRDYFKLKYN